MNNPANFIDYGVYIDQHQSFIITLYGGDLQHPRVESIVETADEAPFIQHPFNNQTREYVRKLCRSIVTRLDHAHNMLIFGPAEAKYELRNELRSAGTLFVQAGQKLVTTDSMTEAEALRFSRSHLYAERTGKN